MDSLGAVDLLDEPQWQPILAFLLNTENRAMHGGRCEVQRSLGYNLHSFNFLVCYWTKS